MPRPSHILAALPKASASFMRANPHLFGKTPAAAAQPAPVAAPAPGPGASAAPLTRARKRPEMHESKQQQALIRWWAYTCRRYGLPERVLMAFPLQGARTQRNAKRMRAEGMREGTPDLLLAVPRKGLPFSPADMGGHGLWIELKSHETRGATTELQDSMINDLRAQGYDVAVCYGYDEAIRTIEDYLRS